MLQFSVGWGKVACLSTNVTIYLKRVKIEGKLLRRAYKTHQRSFERYHPRPPTACPSPRSGVRNSNTKLQSLLSQERVKLRTANLTDTFTGSIRVQKPMKNLGEREWAYPGTAQFFEYPYYLRNGESYELLYAHSFRSIGTKAIKISAKV